MKRARQEKLINSFSADKAGHIFLNGTEVHLVERYQIEKNRIKYL